MDRKWIDNLRSVVDWLLQPVTENAMRPAIFNSYFLILLALTCCSCAVTTVDAPEVVPDPVWPGPPEPPRYRYEATIYNSMDIEQYNEKLVKNYQWTGKQRTPVSMEAPVDVAARSGMIYIADWELHLVHVYDLRRRKYYQFGHRKEGKLISPQAICVDGRGLVYVADGKLKAVNVYDGLGLFRGELGKGLLDRPVGLSVSDDGSKIFVVDNGGIDSAEHRVLVFDDKLQFLYQFGARGGGDGQFNLPSDIVWTPDKKLYVLDAGNFRVQVFDEQGNYLHQWGRVGDQFGDFAKPRSIAADADGNIYVVDNKFNNVQVFDPEGALLINIGHFSMRDEKGTYAMLSGIAIDETQRLYLLDRVFRKLEVIRREPVAN